MAKTPVSLLQRIQLAPNDDAWRQLDELYRPWLERWIGRLVNDPNRVDDLVQNTLVSMCKALSSFTHQGPGTFRAWLKKIVSGQLSRHFREVQQQRHLGCQRSAVMLDELEDEESAASRIWEQEHDQYVLNQLLRRIRHEFAPTTWAAFTGVALQGKPGQQVARELMITENAVYIARTRVMKRLKEEAAGFID